MLNVYHEKRFAPTITTSFIWSITFSKQLLSVNSLSMIVHNYL